MKGSSEVTDTALTRCHDVLNPLETVGVDVIRYDAKGPMTSWRATAQRLGDDEEESVSEGYGMSATTAAPLHVPSIRQALLC